MPQIQVKKVVAVCFLEAVKQVLEQVCAFRVELSQQGVSGPPDLTQFYGESRRLRDYLQRSVSAYQDVVALDFSDADAALMVACCRRSIEAIDLRLAEKLLAADEKNYLQRKRQVLADWAVELAAKPLLELPLKRLSPVTTDGARALLARLQQKVFGDIGQRTKYMGIASAQPGQTTGVQLFDAMMDPGLSPSVMEPTSMAASVMASEPQASFCPLPSASPTAAAPLLDSARLRDPRLRALMVVDLRSYERVVAAGDHRLATILLAAIIEAAVVDHVLPRRGEFGLAGVPESWDPVELLMRVLGDAAEPKDRAMAFNLFASRNLLRPAVQMMAPAIVTAATCERLQEFARRVLHRIGLGVASGASDPIFGQFAPDL